MFSYSKFNSLVIHTWFLIHEVRVMSGWKQFMPKGVYSISPVRIGWSLLSIISGHSTYLQQDIWQKVLRHYFWPRAIWGADTGGISLRGITCCLAFWGKKQAFVQAFIGFLPPVPAVCLFPRWTSWMWPCSAAPVWPQIGQINLRLSKLILAASHIPVPRGPAETGAEH